jgi:ribonuclease P protein component
MIPKSSKFPTRIQFLQFRSVANRLVTPHTTIYHLRSTTPSRLSIIVPIKVSKRATTRNSFKRLTYDTAWKVLKDKNLDCVIIFKPLALVKGKDSENLIVSELNGLMF